MKLIEGRKLPDVNGDFIPDLQSGEEQYSFGILKVLPRVLKIFTKFEYKDKCWNLYQGCTGSVFCYLKGQGFVSQSLKGFLPGFSKATHYQ